MKRRERQKPTAGRKKRQKNRFKVTKDKMMAATKGVMSPDGV
jgi:hypothetical protein